MLEMTKKRLVHPSCPGRQASAVAGQRGRLGKSQAGEGSRSLALPRDLSLRRDFDFDLRA